MIGESVTVISKVQTGTSNRGNPIYSNVSTVFNNCVIGFSSDGELHDVDRNMIEQTATVHFLEEHPDDDMLADAEVIIRGKTWQTEGEGFSWDSPYDMSHVGFALRVRRQNG